MYSVKIIEVPTEFGAIAGEYAIFRKVIGIKHGHSYGEQIIAKVDPTITKDKEGNYQNITDDMFGVESEFKCIFENKVFVKSGMSSSTFKSLEKVCVYDHRFTSDVKLFSILEAQEKHGY